jgi:predicted amidohydrolase
MALSKLKAAACHIAPVFLSAQGTTQKTIRFIETAAANSAKLVVFPESSIPGFPYWSSILAPTRTHQFFHRLSEESVFVDGDEISAIRHAASKHRVTVSLGISEKVRYSTATLFNTNLIIDERGELLVHHRKLMPTFFEKLSWSPGDGHGLRVASSAHGKIGALICGENTNPLARYALMAQGEQVHISTWPAIWPTRPMSEAKTEAKAGRNYNNVAANHIRAAAHCFEAKCFGIMCAGFLDASTISGIASMTENPSETENVLSSYPPAATQFLDPTGETLAGTIVDRESGASSQHQRLWDQEAILYATLDLNECVEGKQYHDVVGGYQRLDVFTLHVNRLRTLPATFHDTEVPRPQVPPESWSTSVPVEVVPQ